MVYPVIFTRISNELKVWIQGDRRHNKTILLRDDLQDNSTTNISDEESETDFLVPDSVDNDSPSYLHRGIDHQNSTSKIESTSSSTATSSQSLQHIHDRLQFHTHDKKKASIRLRATTDTQRNFSSGLNNKIDVTKGNQEEQQQPSTAAESMYFKCRDWIYNAADYTLQYFGKIKLQKELCDFPYDRTIKKIVNSDGTIKWTGCTNKTKTCRERARFDSVKSLRLNTPPCCRHHLLEMLKNLVTILRGYSIDYFLVFGGVIGWHRNGKMVPYDRDLDVIIDGKKWEKVWGILVQLNQKFGHIYHTPEYQKVQLQYSTINTLKIDIWPYHFIQEDFKASEVFVNHNSWQKVPYHVLFPPKKVTFDGVSYVSIPNKVEEYLNLTYGVGKWEKELNCTRIVDKKCIE